MPNPTVITAQPKHEHDCDTCIFLGTDENEPVDYYYHKEGMETLIARFSDQDSDYISGMVFVGMNPWITEADRRAKALGVLS